VEAVAVAATTGLEDSLAMVGVQVLSDLVLLNSKMEIN
jgi:hypothetical protein